jgi:hypothetical protein
MGADLHLHTTASDGRRSPRDLVVAAARAGLTLIALTDHDTVAGIAPARAAIAELGLALRVVTGIELTATWRGRELHLLGYDFDPDHPELQRTLATQRVDRERRVGAMVDRLRDQGVSISVDQVLAEAGSATPGRPHLARALVRIGAVPDEQAAFDRYLSPGGSAFVPRVALPVGEAIALIHRAGGVTSLAHPRTVELGPGPLLDNLVASGLDGIEVVHPGAPPALRAYYRRLAHEHGWFLTGGSDDHGPYPGEADRLGRESIPMSWIEPWHPDRSG